MKRAGIYQDKTILPSDVLNLKTVSEDGVSRKKKKKGTYEAAAKSKNTIQTKNSK